MKTELVHEGSILNGKGLLCLRSVLPISAECPELRTVIIFHGDYSINLGSVHSSASPCIGSIKENNNNDEAGNIGF